MALLDDVKLDLGISHDIKDSDIDDCILAADAELKMSGADAGPESFDGGAIYRRAVKFYCRANYNYQGEAEKWRAAFEGLRDHIAMCGLYKDGGSGNEN